MYLKEAILKDPNIIQDEENVKELALDLIPYSTGFEIECLVSETAPFQNLELMDYSYSSDGEIRFRIQNGLKGFLQLKQISDTLLEYGNLNPNSGIHYHIDFTDKWDVDLIRRTIPSCSSWILEELDTWEYKGTYNSREISINNYSTWVKFNNLHTMEFRLGNMTFDYDILATRIIHCNDIARRFKKAMSLMSCLPDGRYESLNINNILKNRVRHVGFAL